MGSRRGRSEGPSWRGRIKGVEGWRGGRVEGGGGGGVRGYFTALEGLPGVGEQCGNVTFTAFLVYLWLSYVYAHVGIVVCKRKVICWYVHVGLSRVGSCT